jgi:hypothetical protein
MTNVNKAMTLQIGINSQIAQFGSADPAMASEMIELVNNFNSVENELYIEMMKECGFGDWNDVNVILPGSEYDEKIVWVSGEDGTVIGIAAKLQVRILS